MSSASPEALLDLPPFRAFLSAAARWRADAGPAHAVVDAAVEALVAGVDSPSFVRLAGLTRAEADQEVRDLLPDALAELGFPLLGYDDPGNQVLGAAAIAEEYLLGRLTPRELTEQIHRRYGHQCDPLIEALSSLDDDYDTMEYIPNRTMAQQERRVHQAATRLQSAAEALIRERVSA